MGASINKVIIQGRLGQDPEVRYTAGGAATCTLSVATSERWRDKTSGEQKERTEWHRVVFWNKAADTIGEYMRKGDEIYVEGQLQTRSWEQDGVTKYTTEIRGDKFLFGEKGPNNKQQGGQGGQGQGGGQQQGGWGQPQQPSGNGQQQRQQRPPQNQPQGGNGSEPPMDFDDDIPF